MHRYLFAAILMGLLAVPATSAQYDLSQTAGGATYRLRDGGLISLRDQEGTQLVRPGAVKTGLVLHRLDGDHEARFDGAAEGLSARYVLAEGEKGTRVVGRYGESEHEVVLRHELTSRKKGVWGLEWFVGEIPLEMNIIVPAVSGMKLTKDSPGRAWKFDYPITWTNSLIIVEGSEGGFYVWAEDTKSHFKRVSIERSNTGWRLGFMVMPQAPFDRQNSTPSLPWRIGTYTGDWRVPARRYRDWTVRHMRPVPVEKQTPAWVKDTRVCVIMGQDLDTLEILAKRVDPSQTLIYIPSWRAAGYDRNYPEYDRYAPNVRPFIERAHELGFRIMLHVNYFGVDPLNPVYPQFAPYQVRNPFGDHKKEWWLWERADPVIKFAYINPAYKPWRDLFIARMVALCEDLQVDALHLDQTLAIYNDHNGLIDGMTMAEGALALHRELREALPQVALSGEGLNEITMRYEAFAQRHAWGLSHHDSTYHLARLRMAHPIASYLMRPFTILYGYLGCAAPSTPEMYSAWDEAYRNWGIIPTLKPVRAELQTPRGFTRQFLEEARFFTRERVDPALDGPWPAGVAFPYRTAGGKPVYDMRDGRLMYGDTTVSRTLFGVSSVALPGTIEGWRGFNETALIGLEPTRWYPYFDEPRDSSVLHVASLPEGFTVGAVAETPELAFVQTRPARNMNLNLATMMDRATCGSRRFDGGGEEVTGPLYSDSEDGAQFEPEDDLLRAHPPWRTGGSGVTYARFDLDLPEDVTHFAATVALAERATGEGKSDGVVFGVYVRSHGDEDGESVYQAGSAPMPLRLDLEKYAGKKVALELTVDPGPKRSPSFDWARWRAPRVERAAHATGPMAVGGLRPWRYALGARGLQTLAGEKAETTLKANFPGTTCFLKTLPARVSLPWDLVAAKPIVTILSDGGGVIENPRYAGIRVVTAAVDGVERRALFAHPPNFGRTRADFPAMLPAGDSTFHGYVGLRDGADLGEVTFIVTVNGIELARESVLPGPWKEITCPLSGFAGKPVVISLITDSDGTQTCDWALWGDPIIR